MLSPNDTTLEGFYRGVYQPMRLLRARPGTLVEYEGCISHWRRFCANLPLSQVTPQTLAEFAGSLPTSDSPATVNKIMREVMAVLRLFCKQNRLEMPEWKRLRELKRVPKAFTIEEFQAILSEVDKLEGEIMHCPARWWWRSLLLFLWYGGARIGAMLHRRCRSLRHDR
jgi:integrase